MPFIRCTHLASVNASRWSDQYVNPPSSSTPETAHSPAQTVYPSSWCPPAIPTPRTHSSPRNPPRRAARAPPFTSLTSRPARPSRILLVAVVASKVTGEFVLMGRMREGEFGSDVAGNELVYRVGSARWRTKEGKVAGEVRRQDGVDVGTSQRHGGCGDGDASVYKVTIWTALWTRGCLVERGRTDCKYMLWLCSCSVCLAFITCKRLADATRMINNLGSKIKC